MLLSADLTHGLQEWAVACRALGEGQLTLVIRKGGIHERGGGLFHLEHQRFAMVPTYLHQESARLGPAYAGDYFAAVAQDPQPGIIRITHWAEAVHIWRVSELVALSMLLMVITVWNWLRGLMHKEQGRISWQLISYARQMDTALMMSKLSQPLKI
jgi:hypothetical protein